MSVLLAPGAVLRVVTNESSGMTADLGLILHVQQGLSSPYGWFCNPASQASSDFWVSKTGVLEQYVPDPRVIHAWAQGDGNRTYLSVETEGYPGEPLTDAQIATLARLYRWGHETFGGPYVLAEAPGQQGFGWHGMGGTAWGGHLGCPGDIRKAQRPAILAAAQNQAPTEDDVQLSDQIGRATTVDSTGKTIPLTVGIALERMFNGVATLVAARDSADEIAKAVVAALPAPAAGQPVDVNALAAALSTELSKRLAS